MCGPPGAVPASREFDELVEHNLRFRIRQFEMVTIAAEFPDQEATVKDFLTKKHASMKNYIFASDKKDELFGGAGSGTWEGRAAVHHHRRREGQSDLPRDAARIDFLKMRRAIVPALNRIKPWQRPVTHHRRTAPPEEQWSDDGWNVKRTALRSSSV